MARIAVLSDVHGNLEAFEAVLDTLETEAIDRIIHLGDIVGYNANPSECLQNMRDRGVTGVLGNHDWAILDPRQAEGFNVIAYEALGYADRQLSLEDRHYLRGLPHTRILTDRFLLCHGTPERTDAYVLQVFQAKRVFNLLARKYPGIQVCFYGHTHLQRAWVSHERGKVFSPGMGSKRGCCRTRLQPLIAIPAKR